MTASESEKKVNHDESEFTPPLPPDGGWGWMVVIASLLCNIIVDGVCFSFGIFYVEFLIYFGESKAKTAWVGSLVPGMYLSMGPVVSALANKFGCRAVTMVGSAVASVFFFLSTLSPNVNWLIFTYGIMGGIGFGLMYLPSIVIVGYYFDKKRAFATGLAVCGSGIGTFIFAPLSRFLLDTYGWKGANWIISGIILHGLFCGLVFRPLEQNRINKKKKHEQDQTEQCIIMQKIQEEKHRLRTLSTGSLNNSIITMENNLIKDPEKVRQIMLNNEFPKSKCGSGSIPNLTTASESDTTFTVGNDETNVSKSQLELSEKPINKNLEKLKYSEGSFHRKRLLSQAKDESSLLNRESFADVTMSRESLRKREIPRPMYRADIFYTGSVTSIPEYRDHPDMTTYVASVITIPDIPQDSDTLKAKCFPLCIVLKNMLDFSLLKSVTFVILCTASVLAMTGFFTPFVYITDLTLQLGVPLNKASLLLSVLGLFNTIGRIFAGWLSDRPWADCLLIHNLALIFAGVATCTVPWLPNYYSIAIYCAVFGTCIAAFIALRSIVLVDLLGVQKLSNSFGILLLFQGIASIIGSPLSGALFDLTGSYTVSFLVCGVLIAVAGLLCLPIRIVARWENSRNRDFKETKAIGSQYSKCTSEEETSAIHPHFTDV